MFLPYFAKELKHMKTSFLVPHFQYFLYDVILSGIFYLNNIVQYVASQSRFCPFVA